MEPGQRLRLTSGPVERGHQGRRQRLPHGVDDRLRAQHRRGTVMLPQRGVRVGQLLDRRRSRLLQGMSGRLEGRAGEGTREGRPLPQRQGVLEHQHGVPWVLLSSGEGEQFLEPLRIQEGFGRPQGVRVAECGQFDPVGGGVRAGQQGTQPRHMPLDDTTRVQGRRVVPQAVRQTGHGYGGVDRQQQCREQAAPFGRAEWQGSHAGVDGHRAEQPELHRCDPFQVGAPELGDGEGS